MSDQNPFSPESTPDSSRVGFKTFINFFWKELPTSEWVKLLATPIVLSIAGALITNYFQEQSRQNEAVNKYFEQMQQLIVDKNIDFAQSKDSVKTLIKGKSLATLRSVDNSRKEIVLSFLSESDLLNSRKQGISLSYFNLEQINLSGFNLTGINLQKAVLVKANLEGSLLKLANLNYADLSNAKLSYANLSGADLNYAKLIGADLRLTDLRTVLFSYAKLNDANLWKTKLSGAKLIGADLSGADLTNADLRAADLRYANLIGANLSDANLGGANLSLAQNLTHEQIKSACNWEKALYTESTQKNNYQPWIAKDKKANQKAIDTIKQDKSSNLQTPPNCR